MPISIADRQRRLRIPASKLRRVVRAVLDGEGAVLKVSFAFVDGREMRKLNKRHLKHDFDTDVLAFPLTAREGEIVISTDYAAAEAAKRRITADEEIVRYAAHGLLHLLGYDDHAPAEKKSMWMRQERYVRLALR